MPNMRILLTLSLAATLLGTAASPRTASQPSLSIEPAGAASAIEADFLTAAARSRHGRSGDIYTLPQAYNYVVERDYANLVTSHFAGIGGPAVREHRGTTHGTAWAYDTRIPIVLYGPGRIRSHFRPTEPATQQDLPATFAHLMQTTPPRDSRGRILRSALLPAASPPKALLTLVLDQAGRNLYRAHPDAYPNIRRLMDGGTDYQAGRVTHLESETALGHIAIGTGAYPDRSGVTSNFFYHGGHGAKTYAFTVSEPHSPLFLESPTLGDHWSHQTAGQAIVASYCYSDRAAMGMGGHGSYFAGNPPSLVWYYDNQSGKFATNGAYYRLPPYLTGYDTATYATKLTAGTGLWMDQKIGNPADVITSPALTTMEGDAVVRLIQQEAFGADAVPDLLYVTLKGTDAASHRYGYESDEAAAVLHEADTQVGRIVDAFAAKVGAGNFVVALSADHGGTPLPERTGGKRLIDDDLMEMLNHRFAPNPKSPAVVYLTNCQIWLDPNVLTPKKQAGLLQFLRQLKVGGKPFYRLVLDAQTIEAKRAALIRQGLIY
ncbi:MAG: alkaline phosphatase family protein [Candidatus Sericytochromatia bacterium]|nr:alkaline phosphatase family protein [Candidatus Sericytochromatia bacterium]